MALLIADICSLARKDVSNANWDHCTDNDGREGEEVAPRDKVKISGRGHLIQATANGRVYNCDAENPEKGARPEGDETNAEVRCEDIDDPMRGQGRDTKDDEEGDEVGTLRADLGGPKLEPGLEGRKGEECRAESSGNEVAKRGAGGNTCTS